MKFYLFATPSQDKYLAGLRDTLSDILNHVATGSETQDLVIALYLIPGKNNSRGTAYVRQWMTPKQFIARRGHWICSAAFGAPKDLPPRFKLIRLRLDANPATYPREERDIYHWEFEYPTFVDHLATLFAHELHHYRRHHLNLHPREGEQAANRWALRQVQALGYRTRGEKKDSPSKKRSLASRILKQMPLLDPYARFRALKKGSRVIIRHDPSGRHTHETAVVERPIRSHSKRIVIITNDGKHWRWPMRWLDIP